MKILPTLLLLPWFITTNADAQMREKADLIIFNGVIYTADPDNTVSEAMAVKNGRILETGSSARIKDRYVSSGMVDLKGKPLYPGFIDAHCHYYGYALGLQYIDLRGTSSFDEVMERLSKTEKASGAWIVGRGWDQNLWKEKVFPDNKLLNERFPANPVMLIRVDGHSVLANDLALKLAGFGSRHIFTDGQVEMKDGRMTGILRETAADIMREAVPKPAGTELAGLLTMAEKNLFAVGLTSVADAGLDEGQIMTIDSMQQAGALRLHVYAMLSLNERNIDRFMRKGPYRTGRLEVRSVKIYADGSLGSRSARLKEPYADEPGTSGIMVTPADSVRSVCELALKHGYQVNTHCIGDSAVGMMLHIYSGFLKGRNDLRWRIEHAQVVDSADIHLFRDFSIIPSVQATHATSDMKWAGDRLGTDRIGRAYAYRDLLRQNGWLPNGTDFPIENISPLLTFYAAVARKDLSGYPEGGFLPANALTREEALRSITIWAAKAGFLEQQRGSLEPGKDADFVILDRDIMKVSESDLPAAKVLSTYILGKEVNP